MQHQFTFTHRNAETNQVEQLQFSLDALMTFDDVANKFGHFLSVVFGYDLTVEPKAAQIPVADIIASGDDW